MKVTAVFDIGKTNKKFFLFNKNFSQVFKDYRRFDPIRDEDGDECDDLEQIESWMKQTLEDALDNPSYKITKINFSSYGASLVHIGNDGRPVAPLYNYLKPIPKEVFDEFYQNYGGELSFSQQTASPPLGLLNSGLQLYWIKYHKPALFKRIKWSLHLPQYLSYLFTNQMVSEYTSIGCHTGLWDFQAADYHQWVYREGIDSLLPSIQPTDSCVATEFKGRSIRIGPGIHDSSSALIPYIRSDHRPFLLVSTGTWSISLNGFNSDHLNNQDLQHDCLNYMRINGAPVRACRLFLGNEYRYQVEYLHKHYGKEYGLHRSIPFDRKLYHHLKSQNIKRFRFQHIQRGNGPDNTNLKGLDSFTKALHQLIMELVELQVKCIERAIGSTELIKVYIDGGFADNQLFTQILALSMPEYKFRTTRSPLGSALGAAIVIDKPVLNKKFLKKKYAMQKLKLKSI